MRDILFVILPGIFVAGLMYLSYMIGMYKAFTLISRSVAEKASEISLLFPNKKGERHE